MLCYANTLMDAMLYYDGWYGVLYIYANIYIYIDGWYGMVCIVHLLDISQFGSQVPLRHKSTIK